MSNETQQAAQVAAFLTKWQASGAAERANAQLFLNELCGILEVELPHGSKPDEALNSYVFEKAVPSPANSTMLPECGLRNFEVWFARFGLRTWTAEHEPVFARLWLFCILDWTVRR